MAFIHRFSQRVGNAGPKPDHGGFLDAELHGNRVGGLETNAPNVASKSVRVFRHHLKGIGAVDLKDAHCPRGADAVAVQKHHDLPYRLCSAQAERMLAARTGPMPST